jgi:hypothetical protein
MALNTLDKDHKPDYTNTEPSFVVKPNEAWFDGRICTLDPMGHLVQTEFKNVSPRTHVPSFLASRSLISHRHPPSFLFRN